MNYPKPLDPTDFDSICGISPGFPRIPSRFPQTVSKYPNLKCHLNITIYQSGMISSVFEREFQWLLFDILDPYGRLILFGMFSSGKRGFFLKNGRFSGRIWPDWGNTTWTDMDGLGSIGLSALISLSSGQALLSPTQIRFQN